MRIETCWNDGFLYYIEFIVKQDNVFRVIRKHIVLYEELKENEVIEIVLKRFNAVLFVKNVDYYQDVLLIKK